MVETRLVEVRCEETSWMVESRLDGGDEAGCGKT